MLVTNSPNTRPSQTADDGLFCTTRMMANTSTLEEMLQVEPKERRGGGNTTSSNLSKTLIFFFQGIRTPILKRPPLETPGFGGRHDFDSLFPEIQVRIFELVVVSAWKDGLQITPSAVEMSTHPGRRLDDGRGAVGGQVDNTDGSFLFYAYPLRSILICTFSWSG